MSRALRSPGSLSLPTAVLFDFNGVVVDDEPFHWQALRDVVGPAGIALSWPRYKREYLQGDDARAIRQILEDAGKRPTAATVGALVRRKRARYAILCRGLGVEPGIAALLGALAIRVPLALVSGAARAEIERTLRRGGVRGVFTDVVSAEDVRRCKPHPEGYLRAMRRLGMRAGDGAAPLAVEDAPAGIQAAREAGCRVVGITSTFPAARLKAAGAIATLPSLSGVLPDRFLALAAPGRASQAGSRRPAAVQARPGLEA